MRSATLALLLLAGCYGRHDEKPGGHGSDGVGSGDDSSDEFQPSIEIVQPTDSAGIYASTVLSWEVQNFTLDSEAMGLENVDGRGHVHYYLDGVMQDETGDSELPVTLPSGEHTLEVRLAQNDHVELPYTDWVYVQTLVPTITLTAPADAMALTASSADMGVVITDFTLDPAGTEAEFGKGYYALYVDGSPTSVSTDPTVATVTRIPEGPHTVQAELLHVDGSPLVPPVTSNVVDVDVMPGSPYVAMDSSTYEEGELRSASALINVSATNFSIGAGDRGYDVYVDGTLTGAWYDTSFLLTHLAEGRHVVEVSLIDGPEELGVRDIMPIVVAPERPDVDITTPTDAAVVTGPFTLTVGTENFTLNPSYPSANVEGEGHLKISMDGTLVTTSGTESTTLTDLPKGNHVVRVELVNNDETSLTPPVMDQVHVSVN